MYDITDSNSFELIKNLVNNLSEKNYLKKIIISNKNDLESNRNVSYLELKEFLKKNNLLNFDVSILNETNIVELVKNIYKYVNEKNNELNNNKISESLIELKKYDFNNLIKIILLGESEVGKTANYYKNADGILLLFDVCNRNSFDKIKDWINEIKIHSNKSINNDDDKNKLIVYLLGNKIDMERDVIKKEGEKMANELKIKYFEISCKTNININEVINRLIIECYNNSSSENNIKLGNKKESKNKHNGCCSKK